MEQTEQSVEVVREFLLALQDDDLDRSLSYLSDDVQWVNVSLPTVRGKRAVERILRGSQKIGGGFRVYFHAIAAEGDIVLTERTDAITLGRFDQRFWVTGRFEIENGKIKLWRDSFDWADLTIGLLRGLAGMVSPRLNRRWPTA